MSRAVRSVVGLAAWLGAGLAGAVAGDVAWNPVAVLEDPAAAADEFGNAVAVEGELMAVGARSAEPSGKVYVYRRQAGLWAFESELVPNSQPVNFGLEIEIDQGRIAVLDSEDRGTVRIFERLGEQWEHTHSVGWLGTPAYERGTIKKIDLQGNRLALGNPSADVLGRSGAGVVLLFEFDGANWQLVDWVFDQDLYPGAEFGWDVALAGDWLFIGSIDDGTLPPLAGSVSIIDLSGGDWLWHQKLVPSDVATQDRFGASVDADGGRVVVGSPYDVDGAHFYGAVYVFERQGGSWAETGKIRPLAGSEGMLFGSVVEIAGDVIAVGARGAVVGGEASAGAAFAFGWNGVGWDQQLELNSIDPELADQFGSSVALDHAHTLVVGAPTDNHTNQSIAHSGRVYVLEGGPDCDGNLVVDAIEIEDTPQLDCDGNGVLDSCDTDPNDPDGDGVVAADCDANGVPDACDTDPNDPDGDGLTAPDCNGNGTPDACDIGTGGSADVNGNGTPDECECLGDLSGDGLVGLDDLAGVLADFGCTGGGCDGDIDDSGSTGLSDLAILLANFGSDCP